MLPTTAIAANDMPTAKPNRAQRSCWRSTPAGSSRNSHSRKPTAARMNEMAISWSACHGSPANRSSSASGPISQAVDRAQRFTKRPSGKISSARAMLAHAAVWWAWANHGRPNCLRPKRHQRSRWRRSGTRTTAAPRQAGDSAGKQQHPASVSSSGGRIVSTNRITATDERASRPVHKRHRHAASSA